MRLILAAAFLACIITTLAFGQKTNSNDLEFKTLIDRYSSAWSSLDPNNAAPLYAKDADLVFYDIAPLKYTGWADYDQGVRKVFSGFETLKLAPNNDLKVTRRGNVAWTTVTYRLSAKLKSGGPIESDVRHTAIWEKRNGKWAIVHEHFSAPLPG